MEVQVSPQDEAFRTRRDFRSKFGIWFDSNQVCVLSIGKTASSAIIQALIDANVPAYQAHSLSRAPQQYLFVSGLPNRPMQNTKFQIKVRLWLELSKGRPKQFITTFRDPFDRNISAFFEQAWKLGLDIEGCTTTELMAIYEKHGPHDSTRTWFADNISKPFGIDVRDLNLVDEPAQILAGGKRQFLFMKYENQRCWEASLSAYCGRPIALKRRNDSSRKSYSDAISRLRNDWTPSSTVVDRTVDRAVWEAIYTEDEKSKIKERWQISDSHGL